MDSGSTDGPHRARLKRAWVTLSATEAQELLEALQVWAEEVADGHPDADWHTHVSDDEGNELTIAIALPEDDS